MAKRLAGLLMGFLATGCLAKTPATKLVLIGGGDYNPPPLQAIASLAGAAAGNIVVIPWASENPAEAFRVFRNGMMGFSGTSTPAIEKASETDFLEQLKRATGIFFTGGDQVVLIDKLKSDGTWIPLLKQKFMSGTVFGGSSAGTAVMAERMPTGNGDQTSIGSGMIENIPGLGLITGVLVDQHFIKRQRQNRVFSMLLDGPECFAFGIDEGNGVLVTGDDQVEILGPGLVMSIDRCGGRGTQFLTTIHAAGESFSLRRSLN